MPLLLLLSALLTALTGAVAGVRPADVQIARPAPAAQVRRAATRAAPMRSGHAHLLGAFGAIATFVGMIAVPAFPARLYLDRPRA